MSDMEPMPADEDPFGDDLSQVEHDSPPPEGEGPAASPEDFEPDDPDPEASADE